MKKLILPALLALALGAGALSANMSHIANKPNEIVAEQDLTPDFEENFDSYEISDYTSLGQKWTNAWYKHLGDGDDSAGNSDKFNIAVDPTNSTNKVLHVNTYDYNESFFYLTMKDLMVKNFRLTYKFMQAETHGKQPWAGFNFRKEIDGRYNGVTNVMMVMRAWENNAFSPQMYRSVDTSFVAVDAFHGPNGEDDAVRGLSDAAGLIDKWIEIKIEAIDTHFAYYANGNLLGEADITKATANKYGHVSIVSCVDDAYFDDIYLENLDETPYNPDQGGGNQDTNAPTMVNKNYTVNLGDALEVECDMHGEALIEIKQAANTVNPQHYEVDGNKITFSADYIKNLGAGRFNFIIATAGGTVGFVVSVVDTSAPSEQSEEENKDNENVEESNLPLILGITIPVGVVVLGGVGVALYFILRKRK